MHDPSNALLFVDIIEGGSVSAAARAWGITRATAARRLAALEESLGVQLVLRTPHALSPTEAGLRYLDYARRVRQTLTEAESAVHELGEEVRGHLKLMTPTVDLDVHIAPLLASFARAWPEVTLEVHFSRDAREMVSRGFDVGLQVGLEQNLTLVTRRLLQDPMIAVASAGYVAARGAPRTLEELRQHDCLVAIQPDGSLAPWPTPDGGQLQIDNPRLRSDSLDLLHKMTLEDLGLSITPRLLVARELAEGSLIHVLPDAVGGQEWFSLVYPANRIVPAKVRAFIDHTLLWAAEHIFLPMTQGG